MAEKQKARSKPAAKPQGKQGWRIAFLFILLLIGLYLGFAGWTRIYYEAKVQQAEAARANVDCSDPKVGVIDGGIRYCTLADSFAAQQLTLMENTRFYWTFLLPDPIHLILSAFAFGLIGNLARIIRVSIRGKRVPDPNTILLTSGMGGLTAIMMLGAVSLFPSAFSGASITGITLKPMLEPFLCLFAGAFSENIQKWFQSTINKFFASGKEKA